MKQRILITGSEGLIGYALKSAFPQRGYEVAGLDLNAPVRTEQGDVRRRADVDRQLAGSTARITHGPPRTFDVSRFYGDPRRAKELLRWEAAIGLADGLQRLISDFRRLTAEDLPLGSACNG
jgi:nucleoside-diphosphate-sugar epimerase